MKTGADSAETQGIGDAIAIERVLAGDRDAYRVLVERYGRDIYRLAYRMTGNSHDAEEVVQEAFLRAYQKLENFEARANFRTWVYRIAANYAIDRMRQRRSDESHRELPGKKMEDGQQLEPLDLITDAAPSPERLARSAQLANHMEAALQRLTPAERTAVVMRHWEGCAIEEIATVLHSNSSAAKNTIFRAVQKLRRALTPFTEAHAEAKSAGARP
ncbi:MAG TPA: RNA polymerase sigma factor [Candidatus Acidoferrum sp.]|nr:RNA polymerase sigma factor [Candidatus Acidoferrum sp.]